MLRIDGSYQEGGGQILRTSLGLATVLDKEVEIFNIRKKRSNPGLAPQHLCILEAFKKIFGANFEGAYLGSQVVKFYPSQDLREELVTLKAPTAASIGLILQAVLFPLIILHKKISLEIEGGTSGKWAPPVDFYPYVVFPLLSIKAQLKIIKRGYYPKGGGKISLLLENIGCREFEFVERGRLMKIKITSLASDELKKSKVAQRQLDTAYKILEEEFPGITLEKELAYVSTYSLGSEIHLCAYFEKGIIWADALGERGKRAESVGREATLKLLEEIKKGACCDRHLADNLIPYMAFFKGRFKTSVITSHTLTNIWVCENFLGKIFRIEDNMIIAT